MKKILAGLVLLSGLTSLMATLPVNAATSKTYENLTYSDHGGWIEITDCDTSAVSIEIPDEIDGKPVFEIGEYAFSGCSALTQIVIPDCVEKIKQSAFNGCKNLTEIDLPDKLNTIGVTAFADCGFTEVIIPDMVVTIDRNAFFGTPLTSITIPKNVEKIGTGAFACGSYGSGTLAEINVDAENTSFTGKDNVLFNYDQTELICYPAAKDGTEYTIPETVSTLFAHAFNRCMNLESVIISDRVTVLPESAFTSCRNLKGISIPDSVTLIDKTAFAGCSQLSSVYIPKSMESINFSAFLSCDSLTDVYYDGTEEEWSMIKNNSNEVANASIHYNYNGNQETGKGDVNADGEFSVLDLVLLQKWILAVPDTHLTNWKAADFLEDGRLNVFDWILMKKKLIEQSQSETIPTLMIVSYATYPGESGWIHTTDIEIIDNNGVLYEQDLGETYDVDVELYCQNYEDIIQNDQKTALITDAEILNKIKNFSESAEECKDVPMKQLCTIDDADQDYLYVLYLDEKNNIIPVELCRFGGECAWLDDADVQDFVTMLVQNGYFANKSLFEYFLEN